MIRNRYKVDKFFSYTNIEEILPSAVVSYFGDKGLVKPDEDFFLLENKKMRVQLEILASCEEDRDSINMGLGNGGLIMSEFINKGVNPRSNHVVSYKNLSGA